MNEFLVEVLELLRIGLLGKLSLGVVLGGAIGLEREVRGKAAGLRTNILICLGAILFTDLSIMIAGPGSDPGRVAAQVVTGVGFLGAGTILQSRGTVTGLTSAATIWLVAAIGVAIGTGATLEAAGATLLVILVLAALGSLERRISGVATARHVSVDVSDDPRNVESIEQIVRDTGLKIDSVHARHADGRLIVDLVVHGSDRALAAAKPRLLESARSVRIATED
jgi:putative Mg2+ transporter-C (MgtC) family protein